MNEFLVSPYHSPSPCPPSPFPCPLPPVLSFFIRSSLSLPLSVFNPLSLSLFHALFSFRSLLLLEFISHFVRSAFPPLVFHPIHYHFPHHAVVQYQSSSLQTFPSPSITNTSSSPQVWDGACVRACMCGRVTSAFINPSNFR